MDYIAKILAYLKKGEISFIITVIMNALQLYIVCLVSIDSFKDIQWYQQILISLSISLSYTFIFITCIFSANILFLSWTDSSERLDMYFKSNIILYFSIFTLSLPIIVQIFKFIYINNYSFSLKMYCNYIIYCTLGMIINPLLTLVKYIYKKYII